MFGEKTLYSSTITGTGAYTLDAAVGAFKSWRSQAADGSTVFYCAENADGTIWEIGYGTLTYASPDTISRTLVASSTGALITWVAADAPIYVYSAPTAAALNHMIKGGLATSRPAWLQAGGQWLDYTLGLAVTWVKNRWTGSVNIEEGRFDVANSLFTPSPRRPWTATGTSGKTVAAADIGGVFTFNNSAASRTMTLPANGTAGIGHGFKVGGLGLTSGGQYGIVVTPAAGDGIEGGADAATKTIPGGIRFDAVWDEPTDTWRIEYLNTVPAVWTGRRQTVAAGPVDTAGLPTFLPSTNGTLAITAQNVTATARFVATAANGWDYQGRPNDRVGVSLTNLVWTGLTASRAAATPNFLYVSVGADGSLTTSSTIVAPVYQWGGTPATTSGLLTLNIAEMKSYLGNGATAPESFVVFVGEAATDGSGVISTVAYAYNGLYEGAWSAGIPNINTTTTADHKLGIIPKIKDWTFECTTDDQGYLIGEQISMVQQTQTSSGSGVYHMQPLASTRNSMHTRTGTFNAFVASEATTGTNVNLTQASWKKKPLADRGWG